MALILYTVTVIDHVNNPNNTLANTDIVIRTTQAGAPLALIYEDENGLIPISQPGAKTNSLGVFDFYAASANYNFTATVNGETKNIGGVNASSVMTESSGSVQGFIDDYDGFTKNLLKNGNVANNNTPDSESYSKRVGAIINIIDEKVDSVSCINPNSNYLLNDTMSAAIKSFGIIHTGQSLAEGGVGFFNTPTLQPLNSKCFTLRNGPVSVENNQLGVTRQVISEKIRATIGNSLSDGLVSGGSAVSTFFSGAAWGGKNYESLKKGGVSGIYERCISQVSCVNSIDSGVIYKAITIIHGEQDGVDNNTNYSTNLGQWQSDFNVDIKAITGQSEDVQAYICQTATAGGYGNNGGINQLTFPTPLQQLIAHNTNSNVTLVAPKYQYKYYDNAHIKNLDQALHGEKYSQAINYEIQNEIKWEPVRPLSFVKNGNKLIIKFVGSLLTEFSPLVFDDVTVNPISNRGFAYSDSSGNSINNVEITNFDEVTITLNGEIGSNPIVAYAYHNGGGIGNQASGYGDRGNLRDSSIFASKCTGENLPNWCVIFRESI